MQSIDCRDLQRIRLNFPQQKGEEDKQMEIMLLNENVDEDEKDEVDEKDMDMDKDIDVDVDEPLDRNQVSLLMGITDDD